MDYISIINSEIKKYANHLKQKPSAILACCGSSLIDFGKVFENQKVIAIKNGSMRNLLNAIHKTGRKIKILYIQNILGEMELRILFDVLKNKMDSQFILILNFKQYLIQTDDIGMVNIINAFDYFCKRGRLNKKANYAVYEKYHERLFEDMKREFGQIVQIAGQLGYKKNCYNPVHILTIYLFNWHKNVEISYIPERILQRVDGNLYDEEYHGEYVIVKWMGFNETSLEKSDEIRMRNVS